jgi:uncharacterized protein
MRLAPMDLRGKSTAYPPVTEKLLSEIVERILAVGSPLQIVLFGSRARGDYKPDSDLDILIIEELTEPGQKQPSAYRQALSGAYPEITVIAKSLSEVEKWKRVPNHLVTEALTKGRIIYQDNPRLEAALARRAGVAEEGFQYKTPTDLAWELFDKGDSDMISARLILKSEGPYDTVCFHAQQAAEKYLKGFLALHGFEYKKTHELNELVVRCQTVQAFPELVGINFKDFSSYATVARYEGGFWPGRQEAQQAFELASKIKSAILAGVPPKLEG